MENNKKNLYVFVSDVHLGLDTIDPKEREQRFLKFLDSLPKQTKKLFLLGDIFDFWYEYKYVVPRGHVRTLGKLAELADGGLEIYYFKGNHDMWTFGYLEQEIGVKVVEQPYLIEIEGKTFCLGHGHALGKIDSLYVLFLRLFGNKTLQRMFAYLHPRWTFALANGWSKRNRRKHQNHPFVFQGYDEPVFKFAMEFSKKHKVDYFIVGHFHKSLMEKMPDGGEFHILGEWIYGSDFLYFTDGELIKGSGYFPKMEE